MLDNNLIFDRCSEINDLLEKADITTARSKVIGLLDDLHKNRIEISPMVNHFIREVGLYPYINISTASWQEQAIVEAYKLNISDDNQIILHSAQTQVLKTLLSGSDLAVSAPTSFGKSFIIDAFISIKNPSNVVIIVPTIALADETRRRITRKFASNYKIITTTDAELSERNILIFPQERCFSYIEKLKNVDMLIVDEFYKASSIFEDDRHLSLLHAMIELGKISKQKYYLAPNVKRLIRNVFTDSMQFLQLSNFNTVITNVENTYENYKNTDNKEKSKADALVDIINKYKTKSLVYVGSHNDITTVSKNLINRVPQKPSQLLCDFKQWLLCNYGPDFSLYKLCDKAIGVHNGKMHRSLSQIQIRLFELGEGLDTLISTTSIIEGVNTQAEHVILWSNKKGRKNLTYFDYGNIKGRAGRMFKYFVGKIFLLEKAPAQEETTLDIQFTDEDAEILDSINPGIEPTPSQAEKVRDYTNFLIRELGEENYKYLKTQSAFRACDPKLVRTIITKLKENNDWPKNFAALSQEIPFGWRDSILDIIKIIPSKQKEWAKYSIWKSVDNWNKSTAQIYEEYKRYWKNKKKDFNLMVEDLFAAERYLSFNICSVLSVVALIKKALNSNTPDISRFIQRASNAFLPKLVYQLEEYGLPRSLSRKIHDSRIIDLERDDIEITQVIDEFNSIGKERLKNSLINAIPFDHFIIDYFYEGIS